MVRKHVSERVTGYRSQNAGSIFSYENIYGNAFHGYFSYGNIYEMTFRNRNRNRTAKFGEIEIENVKYCKEGKPKSRLHPTADGVNRSSRTLSNRRLTPCLPPVVNRSSRTLSNRRRRQSLTSDPQSLTGSLLVSLLSSIAHREHSATADAVNRSPASLSPSPAHSLSPSCRPSRFTPPSSARLATADNTYADSQNTYPVSSLLVSLKNTVMDLSEEYRGNWNQNGEKIDFHPFGHHGIGIRMEFVRGIPRVIFFYTNCPQKNKLKQKEDVTKIIDETYRNMPHSGPIEPITGGNSNCVSDTSNIKPKKEIMDQKIRCPCGSRLKTEFMIQCSDPQCHVLQHIPCVIIPLESTEEVPFLSSQHYCEICRIDRCDPYV
ncbi:hypothetical protein LXL04_007807 [Taraxacum kok-saghyz]